MAQRDANTTTGDEHATPSTVVELLMAWALVGIPLGWGVWQVAVKSLDLFRR